MDDTFAFIHENIVSYNHKPNSPEKIDEDQTMPDIETSPAKEKNQTTTNEKEQEKEKAQSTVHDSMSNTSLIQEEILSLKRKNPIESLKRLQKLRKVSIGSKSSHSSDAPLADIENDSINLLIQQLKANIFEVGLLNDIEGDTRLGINV